MTADVSLLRSFVDGQGAGAGTYVTYDADLDFNFTAIQAAINGLNAEFRAFSGQNSALIYDLTQTASIQTGFVGAGSFTTSFISGNTTLRVTKGEALTASGRIAATAANTDLVGSGSSGTRYATLMTTGVITLQSSASQGALDLYSVNWNGASFDTATLTRLPGTGANNLIVDADDFQAARIQENYNQSGSAVLPSFTYDQISKRIDDIVRVMGARLTSSVTTGTPPTLRAMALGGSVGTAGLMTSDGTTYDTTTGLYRQAANSLGVTVQGVEAIRFVGGSSQPQGLWRAGTALGTPPSAYAGDIDNGFGYISADYHRAIAGGVSCMEWRTVGGVPKTLVPLGVVGNPSLSYVGDENTGTYSPGADQHAVATAGVQAQLWNANQQRTSATQFRCSVNQSGTQSLNNNTYTALLFNAEDFDVAAMHDTGTNTDRITIPTGGGGLYSVGGYVTFNESSAGGGGVANVGQRGVQVTVNGTVVEELLVNAALAGDTKLPVPACLVNVVATDIVRVTGFQNCGGTMNTTASRAWALHED